MLTGCFSNSLDAKGRVFIPAKHRADLGASVIVAKGVNGYLLLYSEAEWENFMEKLDAIGEIEDITEFKRYIMRGAVPTDVDAQGRICIDAAHRAFAGLEKTIDFVGMRDHVEIWAAKTAEEEAEDTDMPMFRDLSKKFKLGL